MSSKRKIDLLFVALLLLISKITGKGLQSEK